jgi:ABC-type lipopolysaccharide export system ATPase subunit
MNNRNLWTYNDYLNFIMVYAAHADLELNEDEIKLLIEKMGLSNYQQANDIFNKLKDVEAIDIVYEFKDKYIKTEDDKSRLMATIDEILFSNKIIKPEEEGFYLSIHRIIYDKPL